MAASKFGVSHVVAAALIGLVVGGSVTALALDRSNESCEECPNTEVANAPTVSDDVTSRTESVVSSTSIVVETEPPTTTEAPAPPGLADYSETAIGVAVPGGIGRGADILGRPEMQELVSKEFSEVTAENIMKPLYIHPEPDSFSFDAADALIDWAESEGLAVHGHTLLWDAFFNSQVPDWMLNFQGTPDEWRAWTDRYVETFVGRYEGRSPVGMSSTKRSMTMARSVTRSGSAEIGDTYIEEAFLAARRADPNAELYYNDFKFPDLPQKLDGALAMIEDFTARGIPIDGLGFQMHVLDDYPDRETIATAFSRAAATGLKVKVTELDIRVNSAGSRSEFDDELSARQAAKYALVIEEYFRAVPPAQRGGITVWGVSDPESYLATSPDWPLLFDADLQPKESYDAFRLALVEEYGELAQ